MLLRTVLLAAVVAAPLAWTPAPLSAQQGLDRAAAATAQADAVAGWTKNRAAKRSTDLPRGIAKRFEGQTLPPGIRRTRSAPQSAPAPDPEPQPETEPEPECATELVIVNGVVMLKDCDGNLTSPFGTP
jgi:hypothetical protein